MIGDKDHAMPQPGLERPRMHRWISASRRPERPLGVAIIAAWHVVSAVTSVATALFTFNVASRGNSLSDADTMIDTAWLYLLSAPISLVLGLGLWLLARWAWVLTLAFAIVSLVFTFFDGTLSGADLIGALVSAAIIYYMVQPSTRQAFGITPT